MLQESVSWQPIIREPSPHFTIYILFLVVVCVATIVRLVRVWVAAPPFRLSRQAKNRDYLRLLQVSANSLSHWIGFTFLAYAILVCASVGSICRAMQDEKLTSWAALLIVIPDFSRALSMALWVVLFVFLVRWHVSGRISRLRD
jgi:hypothetical protein